MRLLRPFQTIAIAAALAAGGAGRAPADGEFAQFDLSPDTFTGVLSAERGRFSLGTVYSDYEDGSDLNLTLSYALPLGDPQRPVTLRVGPALQYERLETWKAGVRVVAEHYRPTSFGSLFLLGEVSTIDRAYFGLASLGLRDPAVTVELTHQGDDDGYRGSALAIVKPLAGTDLSLRAGYKFEAGEVFVGMSINTF